jgi:uncharacterized protein
MGAMTTFERLTADLTTSMKARTAFRTNTVRQMIAAVRVAEKSGTAAHELTEEQVQAVLAGEVKKRRESAQIYTGAGATERAETETAEADLIEAYLPAALSPEQLDAIVAAAIASTGATTVKDMGTVMKAANLAAASVGRVDGKALSGAVRQALSGGSAA